MGSQGTIKIGGKAIDILNIWEVKDYPKPTIQDNIGSAEYNKALGLRRAQAVVSVLEMQGISKDRIEVISKGEAEPLTDVRSGDANRLNRRVQFKVIETSQLPPPPPEEENKTDDFDE